MESGPMSLSRVPGSPSFRGATSNAVALIPLLSSDKDGEISSTYSAKSFDYLMQDLARYSKRGHETQGSTAKPAAEEEGILLVVPNSSLTRPGDWRYDNTPLKNFHWSHGCQRLVVFDGRPHFSRMAHDRLINHSLTRDWIDLCPHRRTAALLGVLNVRDCNDAATLRRAVEELHQWGERYSTPSYEVTALGRNFKRDPVVKRLFVFDSFHEDCQDIDLTHIGSSMVAFPPIDEGHAQMMDLHLNVVINDLAVEIFREIETRIRVSDVISRGMSAATPSTSAKGSRFRRTTTPSSEGTPGENAPVQASSNLSLTKIASVVSPDSKIASSSTPTKSALSNFAESAFAKVQPNSMLSGSTSKPAQTPQLLTPLDDTWDYSELSPKDAEAMARRDMGRREKLAADLSLLAGSPVDAYDRYSKAAELCKTTTPDPLWYASALEGCAAAHIAMAEIGGYNVDQYLENNFQLPDEIMACAVADDHNKNPRQTTANKQTLPGVVLALCEEALNITNRHEKLAALHAELLLKLAWYIAEVEQLHLRCQWGKGEGCYEGDPVQGKRRWEMTSVAKLKFGPLKNKDGEDVVAIHTFQRCQRFSEVLQRAASTGALDPASRADVAARCVHLCLKGMVPTLWNDVHQPRVRLPRKAALFATVAADSASHDEALATSRHASALWSVASQLFSRESNLKENETYRYGWATLRASTLHALALQGDQAVSRRAAETLLSLLGEISPDRSPTSPRPKDNDDDKTPAESYQRSDSQGEAATGASQATEMVSNRFAKIKSVGGSARANFFTTMTATSSLLTVQSKWADDDIISNVSIPLAESSNVAESTIALKCVWSRVPLEECALAQKHCLSHISRLNRALPVSSLPVTASLPSITSPPFDISSVSIIDSDSHLVLEPTKVKVKNPESQGAMATFFNPYAKQKKGKDQATMVAEGEERSVLCQFENRLSVPLEIPRSQLEFDLDEDDRIKAPALSFLLPAKAKNFKVHFPFIIFPRNDPATETSNSVIDIKGLRISYLSRSILVPFSGTTEVPVKSKSPNQNVSSIPEAASVYPQRSDGGASKDVEAKKVLIQTVPPQPRLLVSFSTYQTPIEEGTIVPIRIADGETVTIPSFTLSNDSGPSGTGEMERIQISAVGLPGQSDQLLFDSDGPSEDAKKSGQKKSIGRDGKALPLVLQAKTDDLDLSRMNGVGPGQSPGCVVSFDLIAHNTMGNRVNRACSARVRFRYRGRSTDPSVELWRKQEVSLRIIRVKGPRISSLTFRSDLLWGSAYSELSLCLSHQKPSDAIRESWKPKQEGQESENKTADDKMPTKRVGLDAGVHVSSPDTVLLLAVTNETASKITLSNRKGLVGGFADNPMPTVELMPGVSVKFPVIFPRIARIDGNVKDVAQELIKRLELDWETVGGAGSTGARRGCLQISSQCLTPIIENHKSFISRICTPPCSVKVQLGNEDSEESELQMISPGTPVDTFVQVDLADWVPVDAVDKCTIVLEFCCARKDTKTDDRRDYIWCGQIRRRLRASDEKKNHRARIAFLQSGRYFVSACAKIINMTVDKHAEEVWWSPMAKEVVVVPPGQ